MKYNGIILFLFLLSWINKGFSQFSDHHFNIQTAVSGLDLPNGITFDQNGIGYIWTMKGRVFLMDSNGILNDEPLLDIREKVAKWLDNGFLGFALHPNYPETPYVYAMYTVDLHYYDYYGTPEYDETKTLTKTATFGRIERYTAQNTNGSIIIDKSSGKILLGQNPEDGFPILFDSHGVGDLVFGEDGTLLASMGDAASSVDLDIGDNINSYYKEGLDLNLIDEKENVGAFRAQMIQSLAGKIIRIDPETGFGVPGNPFFNSDFPNTNASKIWALGLRNGFRFTIKPNSGGHLPEEGKPGQLIIGDVGFESWEEISVINSPGMNLGWPIYEGFEKSEYAFEPINHPYYLNPLASDDCNQYLSFHDLLKPDATTDESLQSNPCNQNSKLPDSIPVFKHLRPSLSYKNDDKGVGPESYLPGFSGEGFPITIPLKSIFPTEKEFKGTASIGGVYYFGGNFPEQYQGKYFHLDFSGWIKVMEFDKYGSLIGILPFYDGLDKPTCLAVNPRDGNLYVTSTTGKIYRISYKGNLSPNIQLKHSQPYGPSPLLVSFDASETTDDQHVLTYHWDFGDGNTASGTKVNHIYESVEGEIENYTVNLSVKDSLGAISTAEVIISVNNAPPISKIEFPLHLSMYPNDQPHQITLSGMGQDSDTEGNNLSYTWKTYLHHEDHFHDNSEIDGQIAQLYTTKFPCSDETYWYRIKLIVEDEHHLSSVDEIEIFPNCNEKYPEMTITTQAGQKIVMVNSALYNLEPTDKILIQRSYNGHPFENLFNLNSSGLTSLEKIWTDEYPQNGINSYRIKLIRENGNWFYSNISTIKFPLENKLWVYPSPAQQIINLDYNKPTCSQLEIKVYNMLSQTMLSEDVFVIEDQEFSHQIDVSNLSPGQYLLTIKDCDNINSTKFLIAR